MKADLSVWQEWARKNGVDVNVITSLYELAATQDDAQQEYQLALAKHDEAIRIFAQVTADYRLGKIGDSEYLTARRAYQHATAEFDAAYRKAAGWE